MKITPKILNIPPYISTTWKSISSMHVKEEAGTFCLIIILDNGLQAEIPALDQKTIELIFNTHAEYVESETQIAIPQIPADASLFPLSFALPMKTDSNVADTFGITTQHNPEQSDLPPLPNGILTKITAIARTLGADALLSLPKAEPGCNCIYCQVMNALHEEQHSPPEEEVVSDKDLQFRNWDIQQTAEKLYQVTNPIDTNEHYTVYLGESLGCTCGAKNCEHIRAVLNT